MGTISSSGLISGLDVESIINQLIAIESRPKTLVEQRVAILQSQKTAFLDINAQLLNLQSQAKTIGDPGLYRSKSITTSNEAVLKATADKTAAVGTYSFTVDRLVSTQQMITGGFADTDTTTFAAATLRFESDRARLDAEVKLAELNGGEGVHRGRIRITDRSGATADIDLTRATTLDDVVNAINDSLDVSVAASIGGDGLVLTDTSGATTTNLAVAELGSTSTTAADLGLLGNSAGTNVITGSTINSIGPATQLARLNDANGVRTAGAGLNDFSITDDSGTYNISLASARTIDDVIAAIETASGGAVTLAVAANGVSLELTGTGAVTVAAIDGSAAAADLGILGTGAGTLAGSRVIAELGSKLLKNLNGGAGFTAGGSIAVTNRAGAATIINLSIAVSVSDVIDLINAAGAGVTASLNAAGNGLKLTDTTGSTAGNLIVAESGGTAAAELGLLTAVAGVAESELDGADVDVKYISESTRLATLNGGAGVSKGKFTLRDSDGVTATVDLTQGDEVTIADVISEINSRPTKIVASINATGDGILLTDTGSGTVNMKVTEAGSTTAKDLGILGEDTDADHLLAGSFEKTVDIEATDTLDDIVTKINDAAGPVSASIINDGSSVSPYRLSLTSVRSGAAGRFLFDDGGLGLGASTLVKGADAVVLYGSSDPTQALLLTSSTNKLTNTIQGVTIDLVGASSSPVQLTVTRNDDAVVSSVSKFAEGFNAVLDALDKYDKYDAENETRGLLLGDSTVATIRNRLFSIVNGRQTGVGGQFDYLTQVGLTVKDGARLRFDEARFREAMAADPDAVRKLFSATTAAVDTSDVDLPDGVTVPADSSAVKPVGFGLTLQALVQNMTDTVSGLLTNKTDTIDTQIEQANKRIEQLNDLLGIKRSRLEAQFNAMEQALAQLQDQSAALAGLQNLATASQSNG